MKTNQIDLEDDVHEAMKKLTHEMRITVKTFMVEAVKEKIKKENNKG